MTDAEKGAKLIAHGFKMSRGDFYKKAAKWPDGGVMWRVVLTDNAAYLLDTANRVIETHPMDWTRFN